MQIYLLRLTDIQGTLVEKLASSFAKMMRSIYVREIFKKCYTVIKSILYLRTFEKFNVHSDLCTFLRTILLCIIYVFVFLHLTIKCEIILLIVF